MMRTHVNNKFVKNIINILAAAPVFHAAFSFAAARAHRASNIRNIPTQLP